MPKFYNISDWSEQSWWNTGGTRDKKIYMNHEDGELYYFKQSFKKGNRDYKHEFWSEIIASEIGLLLGFDILSYHIAIRGNIVGCISKSMIKQVNEELIEGGKYLQAFDNTFNPENVKLRNQYNFDLIFGSLVCFDKEEHLTSLMETIVFDALIGNSDRHQENWAIISINQLKEEIDTIEVKVDHSINESVLDKIMKLVIKYFHQKNRPEIDLQTSRLMLPNKTRFAPIYDSGCSFGRELDDEKVKKLLNDEIEIDKYVRKGLSEIHWENNKITHFELLLELIENNSLRSTILNCIKRIIDNFDIEKVTEIVLNVDKELIATGNTNFLPQERKELILKLLTLRKNKLKEIYSKQL